MCVRERCMCVRESNCVCVCVCVYERGGEGERERKRERERGMCIYKSCVFVCMQTPQIYAECLPQ